MMPSEVFHTMVVGHWIVESTKDPDLEAEIIGWLQAYEYSREILQLKGKKKKRKKKKPDSACFTYSVFPHLFHVNTLGPHTGPPWASSPLLYEVLLLMETLGVGSIWHFTLWRGVSLYLLVRCHSHDLAVALAFLILQAINNVGRSQSQGLGHKPIYQGLCEP